MIITGTLFDTFNNFLQTQLNPEQYEAVTHREGGLLIVAGAGSGKTRVITARITYLMLHQHALAEHIIALTFTNKAALEMKERIRKFLMRDDNLPFIGTFHSFCLRLLKQNSHLLADPFFSILDEDDQHTILQSIITKSGLQKKITAKQLSYHISTIKNQSINPLHHELLTLNPLVRDIYTAYEKERKASRCLDFDDLLLETVKLFSTNSVFKNEFQATLKHILVDEYQDTNAVQHELLKLMAHDANKKLAIQSVCAVGDEDQSIYSWRGATIANIMNFSKDFATNKIIKIEQNYRSVQPILEVANQVISYNTNRNPKKLWSSKKATNRIKALTFLSEYQEGQTIALYLKQRLGQQKLSSIAILYRTHFQSRIIEEALIKHSLPYKIIGGTQFYERKEIKDIIAYLKLIINPFDKPSFFRVINCPLRGLGNKFEELFKEVWDQQPLYTFKDTALSLIEKEQVTGTKKDSLLSFIALFDALSSTMKVSTAVKTIIKKTEYLSYLKETYDPDQAIIKIDNVKELQHAIEYMEADTALTIASFLEEVTLMQAHMHEEDTQKDHVLLMTLHAAKGLEFDTVIITGLEEGLLPSSRSLATEDTIEEERRLFYVGITRAQERLIFTHSKYRYQFGSMNDQRLSRFMKEMPIDLVSFHDASYWSTLQTQQFFSQWLHAKPALIEPSLKIKKSEPEGKTFSTPSWKKKQPIHHAKFGIGIIEDIELRSNGSTYLHIHFKTGGLKKIEAQFVKAL